MYVADEEALAAQDPHPAVTSTKPRAAPAPATRRPSRSQVTGKETAPPDEANPHAGTVLHGPAFPAENVADLRLLCSVVPAAPSEALMEALVSAAPLSYNAVRAGPAREGRPLRWFCEICGYWGRVRCLNCGARVCGLACKVAHDEDRCQKYPG
jgi:zinc finger HIT domain-containing protein 1